MTKKLNFICITILLAVTLGAQDNTTDLRNRFGFGVKAGINYSNVYDTQGESFVASPKAGLAAGIYFAIPFNTYLGIQPEILFSQKGFKASGMVLNEGYRLTRTTDHLDVPLYLAFKPSEFITLLAGPQFSYLISHKDAFGNTTTSIATETEFRNADLRKNTLSFSFGIDLTMKHLVIGVRAAWDVQENQASGPSTTPRYKNTWYQATLGYRLYKN